MLPPHLRTTCLTVFALIACPADSLGTPPDARHQLSARSGSVAGATTQSVDNINLWYGNNQEFGNPGKAQRWANVLGTFDATVATDTLWYSLRGGSFTKLKLGPDSRRLLATGDFNIELDFADLVPGNNAITILAWKDATTPPAAPATYRASAKFVAEQGMTVDYNAGQTWPQTFQVNWASISNVQQKAQVVDGYWTTDADGLRCEDMGYDRLIAIGDVNWEEYEVTATMTLHAMDPNGFAWPSVSPGFGITLRWPGHSDTPVACTEQPSCGWLPSGGTLWYDAGYQRLPGINPLQLSGDNGMYASSAEVLQYETPYKFRIRVDQLANGDSQYFGKVWPSGSAEPAIWDLAGTERPANPSDEPTGSAIIIAHHVDISVKDVSISPLVTAGVPGTDFASDNFDCAGTALNSAWEFVNPSNEGGTSLDLSSAYRSGGALVIDADTNFHSAYYFAPNINTNNAPAVLQSVGDVDFTIEAKIVPNFNTNAPQQTQGLMVQESPSRFLRFDVSSIQGTSFIYDGVIRVGGNPAIEYQKFGPTGTLDLTQPLYLRISRTGTQWQLAYSANGVTYTPFDTFTATLVVNRIGVFIENERYWGFDALFDYVVDVTVGGADCNSNGELDGRDVANGALDCDGNAVLDECEGPLDCNTNGIDDATDINNGDSDDCNANSVPDECEAGTDCNDNGTLDECELVGNDCNGDNIPDDCQLSSNDCNADGTPDDCQLAGNDCNTNGLPDECDTDCDANGTPDNCEPFSDCNTNGINDRCELAANDCNANDIPDACDLAAGTSLDANSNGTVDECEECAINSDCNDGNACTTDTCVSAICQFTAIPGCGGGPECEIEPHDCCISHLYSACSNATISACVCASDPFCCLAIWDRTCVNEVASFGCGACDGSDDCNDNSIYDSCEPDLDGDGLIDECDSDIDDDGIGNAADTCDDTPPGAAISPWGAPIGDANYDCVTTVADHVYFEVCLGLSGPGHEAISNECRGAFDIDRDWDVDLMDFATFQLVSGD